MNKGNYLRKGIVDGIPIALGYFAVSFSLGIQAKQAGMSAFYATLMSFTNLTSAGEFAGISVIREGGTYIEMAICQLIINLRYMLMSCALSQKFDSSYSVIHRFIASYGITDEIFGISIASGEKTSPIYMYGAILIAAPAWSLGTLAGVILGNILPAILVNALSVSLYGMFIAIFVPPAKADRNVGIAVILAMIASFAFSKLPYLSEVSGGMKVIILTVAISLAFAVLCPVKDEENVMEEG